MTTAIECLVGTRPCAKYYANIISFNIPNNLMRYCYHFYLIDKNSETEKMFCLLSGGARI